MIDERELIKTLLQWKENGNKFAGLKENAWKGRKGKMVRCDKAMRRSKEKPVPYIGKPWRCNGQCKTCVCGLHKNDDGTWSHTPDRKDGRVTECR